MVAVKRRKRAGGSRDSKVYICYCLAGGLLIVLGNYFVYEETQPSQGHAILQMDHPSKRQVLSAADSRRKTPPGFEIERRERREREEKEKEDPIPEEHPIEIREAKNKKPLDVDKEDGRISEDEDKDHNNEKESENDNTDLKEPKITYVSPNGDVLEKPEGTGPTKLGYVMDFVHERGHPKFRTSSTLNRIETGLDKHATKVATSLSETNVQPCDYFDQDPETEMLRPTLLQRKVCRDPERALVVYNGASFPRTWCGVSIPPKGTGRIEEHCKEPVHLFEKDFPPVNGEGMSPIVLHSQADTTAQKPNVQPLEGCTIPCHVEKDMTGINRYIQGTDWTIYHSYQDPNAKREVQMELSKFKHDEYYSSAYFKSDIPLSRIDLDQHNLRNAKPPVDFDSVKDSGVYIVNEICGATNSRRTRWKDVLENQYHVDSLGKCQHSKDLEPGESIDTLEGRLAVMGKYKFALGYEISTHKDWVTEVAYEAMLSGAVPIVLGAVNSKMHLPRNGAIFVSDFNSFDKLAAYVNVVAKNKTLWNSYHAWRKDEKILAAFERKYQFTKTSPECRMCSWAYAKLFGLSWDHQLQKVQETHIERRLCVDEASGLAVKPFREELSVGDSSLGAPDDDGSCSKVSAADEKHFEQDGWSIVKSVVQHDSITDIIIHKIDMGSSSGDATLTLEYKDVNNTEAAFFANSHTLVETERGMLVSSATVQDHKTKITVLANWETTVWSPRQGVVKLILQGKDSVPMHEDEQRRIRVISEDMGQLHEKMTEYYPSSFSKRMIQDFIDPLELFYLDT